MFYHKGHKGFSLSTQKLYILFLCVLCVSSLVFFVVKSPHFLVVKNTLQ